jgi:hypothetical protein
MRKVTSITVIRLTPTGLFAGAIANLAWLSDSYLGKLPSRRIVFVCRPWDGNEPIPYPSYLHVDFIRRELSLDHIPTEWLNRSENAHFFRSLRSRTGYAMSKTGAIYDLDMSDVRAQFNKRTTERLEFFDKLCMALGLPKAS